MKMYIAVGFDCMEADIFGLREIHGEDSPLLQSALLVFANNAAEAEALADERLGGSHRCEGKPILVREIGQFHSTFGEGRFFHGGSNFRPTSFHVRDHNDTGEGVLVRADAPEAGEEASANWHSVLFKEDK